MVKRDLRQLADTPFDLLVIGGGIYGAAAAWDATQRGLSVAVIDKGDFGGGTSFNSAKTVHGGVRALQSGNLAELRQFVRERRALSHHRPLSQLDPTYVRFAPPLAQTGPPDGATGMMSAQPIPHPTSSSDCPRCPSDDARQISQFVETVFVEVGKELA